MMMASMAAAVWLAAAAQADAGTGGSEKPEKMAPDVERLPFTPDTIKQVVDFHLDKIQGCYNEMLAAADKPKQGTLKTSWVITPEGLVSKAKVEKKGTTLRDPKLNECVVAVLSIMTFPKPPDGKAHPVEFPFTLKATR